MNETINTTLYFIGAAVVGYGLGVILVAVAVGTYRLVNRILHKVKPLSAEEQAKADEQAATKARYANTWAAGYAVGVERTDFWKAESVKWFERYLDQINPRRVIECEEKAQKEKDEADLRAIVTTDNQQAVLDTDE